MIKLQNVFYRYDECEMPALDDVSLEINKGEYVALIGPNGCGKTTLIRQLNALLKPDKGIVTIDGLNTSIKANHREIRRLVGMIFQNPDNQIVGMTVEEDIAFGPGNLNLPPFEIRQRVNEILKSLELESLAPRAPHTLSGGEKRLVSLAGVLIMNPHYIAFDEPTAYLDPEGKNKVLQIMERLHREGIGIIHITHDPEEMAQARRLLVMNKGKIILDGPPRNVFKKMAKDGVSFISLPPIMALMHHLAQQGWPLTPDILSVKDAGQVINRLLADAGRERQA